MFGCVIMFLMTSYIVECNKWCIEMIIRIIRLLLRYDKEIFSLIFENIMYERIFYLRNHEEQQKFQVDKRIVDVLLDNYVCQS